MTIENVSDTALWVAAYRAMETERPDALFRDPYAAGLSGERGRRIVDELPHGRDSAWAIAVRTQALDELILSAIERRGVRSVVNLAAGLDARPYRLPLPPDLRWTEVDLPAMIGYKEKKLRDARPRCRLERVELDLADEAARRAFLERFDEDALVITEGLLIYLEREQVASLARDLAAQPRLRWWLLDFASPALLEILNRRWGPHLRRAPFRFGVDDAEAFFGELGWTVAERRFACDEARRLRREMPYAWIWRLLVRVSPRRVAEKFRRMSGYVLLEKAGPA